MGSKTSKAPVSQECSVSPRQASVMFGLKGVRKYIWNAGPVTDWFTTHIEFSKRICELLETETGEEFSVGEMGRAWRDHVLSSQTYNVRTRTLEAHRYG